MAWQSTWKPVVQDELPDPEERFQLPVQNDLPINQLDVFKGWGDGGLNYQPTYWENPYNIAKAYNYYNSLPPNQPPPGWLDQKRSKEAYDYFQWANEGRGWTSWGYLDERDPMRQYLQGMEMPTPDFILTRDKYYEYMASIENAKPASEIDRSIIAQLPPGYQHYFQQKEMQEKYDQWSVENQEQLPMWHKTYQTLLDNPKLAPIVQMGTLGFMTGGRDVRALLGGLGLGGLMTIPEWISPTAEIGNVNLKELSTDITMGAMKAVNLLFDFDGDLYGERVRLEFHARLRDEERFAGPDALVARIREDAARARALLPGPAGDWV